MNLDEILRLIENERYFVLHARRQTGKTSTLLALRDPLNRGAGGDYRCVCVNVEAAQAVREDVESAMRVILGELGSRALLQGDGFLDGVWPDILARFGQDALGAALTRWCMASPKPLVLLIDEIDSLVGDTLISVLRRRRAHREEVRPGPGAHRPPHRVATGRADGAGSRGERGAVRGGVRGAAREPGAHRPRGLAQTAGYMDRCGTETGHLVIFDRSERNRWKGKLFRREERPDGRHAITVWGM